MDYFLAVIAGLIQGVAEFLPISSSGHLVLFHEIFGFNFSDNVLFDVILHLGTFAALVVCFWRDLIAMAKGFFFSFYKPDISNDPHQKLAWLIIVGTIPGALAGYFFDDAITSFFHDGKESAAIVALMLVVVALLFFWIERIAKQSREAGKLNLIDAIVIGLAQAVALIPGTSRSGITIIAGLWRGLKREEAAKFSFLLSMPIVLGAGISSLKDVDYINPGQAGLLVVGFFSAWISGLLAVKFLLKYLNRHSFSVFAWYRLGLALVIVLWLLLS